MSSISDFITINISRQTTSLTRANFGTPGIISEFETDKTNTAFNRFRFYTSLTEMINDGWETYDPEYIRASLFLQQNPRVSRFMIGRKDVLENWTQALTAIQTETENWYAFTISQRKSTIVTFNRDFEAGDSVIFTINGVAVTAVPFATDHATTMANIETQIEADITGSTVTVDATARTVQISVTNGIKTVTVAITGANLSQTTELTEIPLQDTVIEVSTWTETQRKIFFYTTSEADTLTQSADPPTDLAGKIEALNRDRTVIIYHPDAQTQHRYLSNAWIGRLLPFDPGTVNWSFQQLSGVPSYEISSSQRGFALGKNVNIFTETAGIDHTEFGTLMSGEYIDIIHGLDWLEARLGENIFETLINEERIPYSNEGLSVIEGLIKQILDEAVGRQFILTDYTVTVPLLSAIPNADKIARNLPDVTFTATLAGAINTITINGVVSA